MPPPRCQQCPLPAALLRPRCGTPLCSRCFVLRFEAELLGSITPTPGSRIPIPAPGSSVAVAASGGKDSTVLSHLLQRFAPRLRLRLALVSVDEGIAGYREAALAAVRQSRGGAPLLVLSHREVFGWSVDEVGAALGAGSRCTFCGVLRRQALERAARMLGADWIATGHNADDIAETLLMNFLRGDVARLRRTAWEGGAGPMESPMESPTESPMGTCRSTKNPMDTTKDPPGTSKDPIDTLLSSMGFPTPPNPTETASNPIETTSGTIEATPGPVGRSKDPSRPPAVPSAVPARRRPPWPPVPRCKPLRHACEKEIVLYAHFRRLRYVSTECVHAARAFRGHARALLKALEAARPAAVPALGHSSRRLPVGGASGGGPHPPRPLRACARCGFASSQGLCKACVLQGALQRGRPRVALGKRALGELMGEGYGADGGHQGDGYGAGGCSCGAGDRQGEGYGAGGCSCGAGDRQGEGYGADGGHQGDGYGAGGCSCGAGDRQGEGYGADGGHQGDGYGAGGCSCGAGDRQGEGYGADGGHKGDGYGAGGCSCGAGDRQGEGYGADVGHKGDGYGAGGCSCGAGDHKDDGYGAGDHWVEGGRSHGAGDRGYGGNGEGTCRAREAVDPRAGVEVEVVGAGGRSLRKRVVGLGRVRGALNIWDF